MYEVLNFIQKLEMVASNNCVSLLQLYYGTEEDFDLAEVLDDYTTFMSLTHLTSHYPHSYNRAFISTRTEHAHNLIFNLQVCCSGYRSIFLLLE